MSFYIVVKGHLTPFSFPYVDQTGPVRVDSTLIHGERPKVHTHSAPEEVYAYQVMTKNVLSISPAQTVKDAKKIMEEMKIHHLPLIIDHKLVGLVSSHDIVGKPDLWDEGQRLDKIMTKMILATGDGTPLRDIAHVFLRENINALPVIDDDLRLCGIITHRDLLRWLIENHKFQK